MILKTHTVQYRLACLNNDRKKHCALWRWTELSWLKSVLELKNDDLISHLSYLICRYDSEWKKNKTTAAIDRKRDIHIGSSYSSICFLCFQLSRCRSSCTSANPCSQQEAICSATMAILYNKSRTFFSLFFLAN